jgi:tetratricopeptide (TPR) repeat protein
MAGEIEVMKRIAEKIGTRGFGLVLAAVVAVGGTLPSAPILAQEKTASIHGHVNNAAGQVIQNASVRLTLDKTTDPKKVTWKYTFPIDANGDYKGTGIAPDTYLVVVVVAAPAGDTTVDYFEDQTFKAGEDKLETFDMTRKEFIDKMTPEQKTALEAYKKSIAETMAANKTVGNLNALLKTARDANAAGKYADGVTAMTTATQQAPDQSILWLTLGDSQLGVADQAAKAAKAAGTPVTDASVTAKYADAATSFKKAIDLNATAKKPNPEVTGSAYNELAVSLSKSGDIKGAQEAFESAAKANKADAGRYYMNAAITLYNRASTLSNIGPSPELTSAANGAAAEADNAVAADPKKVDAYYIKGQALILLISPDGKTTPPGCVEAYQKYLELSPDGPHAADIKSVLSGIGAPIKSSYKAGKKS